MKSPIENKLKHYLPYIQRQAKRLVARCGLLPDLWEDFTQEGLIRATEVLTKDLEAPQGIVLLASKRGMLTSLKLKGGSVVKHALPSAIEYPEEQGRLDTLVLEKEDLPTKDLMLILTVLVFQKYPIETSATLLFSDQNSWYYPLIQELAEDAKAIYRDLEATGDSVDAWLNETISKKNLRLWKVVFEIKEWEPEIVPIGFRQLGVAERALIKKLSPDYIHKDLAESFGVSFQLIERIANGSLEKTTDRTPTPAWAKDAILHENLSQRQLATKYYISKAAVGLLQASV